MKKVLTSVAVAGLALSASPALAYTFSIGGNAEMDLYLVNDHLVGNPGAATINYNIVGNANDTADLGSLTPSELYQGTLFPHALAAKVGDTQTISRAGAFFDKGGNYISLHLVSEDEAYAFEARLRANGSIRMYGDANFLSTGEWTGMAHFEVQYNQGFGSATNANGESTTSMRDTYAKFTHSSNLYLLAGWTDNLRNRHMKGYQGEVGSYGRLRDGTMYDLLTIAKSPRVYAAEVGYETESMMAAFHLAMETGEVEGASSTGGATGLYVINTMGLGLDGAYNVAGFEVAGEFFSYTTDAEKPFGTTTEDAFIKSIESTGMGVGVAYDVAMGDAMLTPFANFHQFDLNYSYNGAGVTDQKLGRTGMSIGVDYIADRFEVTLAYATDTSDFADLYSLAGYTDLGATPDTSYLTDPDSTLGEVKRNGLEAIVTYYLIKDDTQAATVSGYYTDYAVDITEGTDNLNGGTAGNEYEDGETSLGVRFGYSF